MIEATATPVLEDTHLGKPASVHAEQPARAFRRSSILAAGWLAFSAGLVWFIYAGSVRVGAGHWFGQRLRVRVIWSRFLAFLADHGANALLVGLVAFAAALTLIGSLALLWWVLGQRSDVSGPAVPPDAS